MSENPEEEIQKVWVVSSAHITERDNILLHDREWPHIMFGWEHGYWLWVPGPDWLATFALPHEINVAHVSGFSVEICNLWKKAIERGVQWLRFDSDGPKVDRLPVFDW